MKLKSIIKSNKELKKNGYKMLRKLHKMEKKKGAIQAYEKCYEDTYMFVLYCRGLAELIENEYTETNVYVLHFEKKINCFLEYLDFIAKTRSRISKKRLVSFLKAYTKFFNKVITEGYKFKFDAAMIEKWNAKCIVPYVATWGK